MKSLFFSIIVLLVFGNLKSLPLYYPYAECGFFADGAVEGVLVENPEIGFYGLVDSDDTSAVVWDTNCLTDQWSGAVGWTGRPFKRCDPVRVMGTVSYFNCGFKGKKNIDGNGLIQLFAINGGGIGGTIPEEQTNYFHFCNEEIRANALIATTYAWCDGITLYPAVGYGFISQNQTFESQLVNFALADLDNGTIHESLDTTYHGVNLELGISKRFCQCWVFTAVPFFGIYRACTEIDGVQNWGQIGFPTIHLDKKSVCEVAYRGGLRGAILWEWCEYHIGAEAFVDYLSYVPGIYNPREDNDGPARITKKNSFRYGGGLVIGRQF